MSFNSPLNQVSILMRGSGDSLEGRLQCAEKQGKENVNGEDNDSSNRFQQSPIKVVKSSSRLFDQRVLSPELELLENKRQRPRTRFSALDYRPSTKSLNYVAGLRKALSLEDLSTPQNEVEMGSTLRVPLQIPSGCNGTSDGKVDIQENKEAANKICHYLILNAWRRRRQDINDKIIELHSLSQQIEQLNLQISFLRNLLESEKRRVSLANAEVQRFKSLAEEALQKKDAAVLEQQAAEKEVSIMEEKMETSNTLYQNSLNDYLLAKEEIRELEIQLGKEREKIKKLRDDKKLMLEKINVNESLVTNKNKLIEQVQNCNKELERKLALQVDLCNIVKAKNNSLQGLIKEINEEKSLLTLAMDEISTCNNNLENKVMEYTDILNEKEENFKILQKNLEQQKSELINLQMKLVEQQNLDNNWRARVYRFATTFARFPSTILSGLSFVLLPAGAAR